MVRNISGWNYNEDTIVRIYYTKNKRKLVILGNIR